MKRLLPRIYLVLLILTLLPLPALAGSDARITRYDRHITVTADGDLRITEDVTCVFTDKVNGIYRNLDQTGSQGITDFSASVTVAGESIPFELRPKAKKGDSGVMTLKGDRTLRYQLYTPMQKHDTATYHFAYAVQGAVLRYGDIGYLRYALLEGNWEMDIDALHVTLTLPDGARADLPQLRLYGGRERMIAVEQSAANAYTVEAAGIPDENRIGLRLYIPATAIPGAPITDTGDYLDTMLADEARQDLRIARQKSLMDWSLKLSPLLLLLFLLAYLKADRDPASSVAPCDVQGTEPDDTPPAELCLLMPYHLSPSSKEISATMMHLCDRGYIVMHTDDDDQSITLERTEKTDGLLDYEQTLLDYLFITLSKGESTLEMKQIKKAAQSASSKAQRFLSDFQKQLIAKVKARGWFDGYYVPGQPVKYLAGAVLVAAAIYFLIMTVSTKNVLGVIPVLLCTALGIYAFCMRKRTPEACQQMRAWQGYAQYLQREQLDTRDTDPAVWQRRLVYACVLLNNQNAMLQHARDIVNASQDVDFLSYNLLWGMSRGQGHAVYSHFTQSISTGFSSSSSSSGGFGGGGGGGGTF